MYDILQAVERLEFSLELLKSDLNSDDDQIEHVDWILGTARMAFNERYFLIAETLQPAKMDTWENRNHNSSGRQKAKPLLRKNGRQQVTSCKSN